MIGLGSDKNVFSPIFFHAWYGEQFLFEKLRECHDKLLSLLSQLSENSLLIFWKIWYRVIYKQTFLIIYLNLLETCCLMLISSWKELLLLHIICNLLCYANTIQRNWTIAPQINCKNQVFASSLMGAYPCHRCFAKRLVNKSFESAWSGDPFLCSI